MEVYGESGYVFAPGSTTLKVKNAKSKVEKTQEVTAQEVNVYQDPFSYFADVINGKLIVPKNSPYSLENNVTVVRILEAARESARSGKAISIQK